MTSANSNSQGLPLRSARVPWRLFLFLTVVFFLVHHDLLFSTKVTDNFMPSEDEIIAGVNEGSPIHRIALLSLGLFAIVSLVRHRPHGNPRITGMLGWTLLSFATWALLSPVWSGDFSILTVRRLSVFGILCIAALAVARRLSLREIILWAFFSTTGFLVIGVLAEVFLGTFRPLAPGYRFAGTLHPNVQGVNCALVALSGMAAADLEKRGRTMFRACATVGIIFLILTGSRTAFAAIMIALAVYLTAVCSRKTKIAAAYATAIVFCLLLLFLGNAFLPNLRSAALLGRDDSSVDTFNGRDLIWDECAYYVARRPMTGYGFGGFWTQDHIAEISNDTKWGVSGAHSAYIDCLLQVGLVGLLAYILTLIIGIGRAFRFYNISQNSVFAFCGALLVFCAIDGLFESVAIIPTSLMFLSAVAVTRLALTPRPTSRRGT